MVNLSKEYIAGFVDGEGTISVRRIVKTGTKSGVAFRVVIRVANCDLPVLEALKERYGGWICKIGVGKKVPKTYKWRQCYRWEGTNRIAKKALLDIRDHLIIKRKEAEYGLRVIELCDAAKGRFTDKGKFAGATAEEVAEKQQIYEAVKGMHTKELLVG